MQNRRVPSGFGTMMRGLDQGLRGRAPARRLWRWPCEGGWLRGNESRSPLSLRCVHVPRQTWAAVQPDPFLFARRAPQLWEAESAEWVEGTGATSVGIPDRPDRTA